jgi:predicted dehydrogenase
VPWYNAGVEEDGASGAGKERTGIMKKTTAQTRRTFLRNAGMAGTAAMTTFACSGAAGANDRLNMAFIGCGGMAGSHLDSLLGMLDKENIRIAAVCDVYKHRAELFQKKIRGKGSDTVVKDDYRAVLGMKDVDYVLIATPEHSHAYLTLDALDAGKHVYVEKPITHTIPEALAVVKKTNATGLQVQVGVQGMADDSYASAQAAIRAGKIGSVVQAQIDYVRNYTKKGPWRRNDFPKKTDKPDDLDWQAWLKPAPDHAWDAHRYFEWRCYSDYSGGIATDLFVHRITRIIRACGLGMPARVCGMGGIYTWPDGRDLPDSLELVAEYPAIEGITKGMTLHILGTMANDDGNDHCIRGTKGTLKFRGGGWKIFDDESGEEIESHIRTGGEDVTPHHKNHHKAIREGAPLNCPVELGLYGLGAVRMANLSWFEKKMMAWDETTQAVKPV